MLALLAILAISAATWFYRQGYVLYYGDAEAHLNTARRIVDSRNPGYDQVGSPWLPVPHALMLPFVGNDRLWQTGLAGTIPSAICFVLAGVLLFAATRRLFQSTAAGVCAAALFALNPNLLYLQSTPMTEPVFFLTICGLLYCTVLFHSTQSMAAVVAAAFFSMAASLTRYEGWSLIPFVAAYFLVGSKANRVRNAALFSLIAAIAPLYWMGHNWWYYGTFFEFYFGPYSAKGIYARDLAAGMARFPTDHDWPKCVLYFRSAAQLAVGPVLLIVGCAGIAAALLKKAFWPVIFLGLPPVFYVLSMYSSGVPIFVPHLWPNGYYNTRYGLAVLPLLALSGGALVALAPQRIRALACTLVVLASVVPWLAYPRAENWICWKESQVNSVARRAWTSEAAAYLRKYIRPGDTVFASFGDQTGIFREAGIPMHQTIHDGDNPQWMAAMARPDLFLKAEWAVTRGADLLATTIDRAAKNGPQYRCVKIVSVKDAPVIQIFRRETAPPIPVP
ncbi:MAG: glycosyltransferase family 39 protein [Bryobacteraceae bacterium]